MIGAVNEAETFQLRSVVLYKLHLTRENGAGGWFEVFLGGILANVLVGFAAVQANMARTAPGKIACVVFPGALIFFFFVSIVCVCVCLFVFVFFKSN